MSRNLTLIAVLLCLGGCGNTQPRYGEVMVGDRSGYARIVFSDSDRVLIRDYYANRYRGLPPGLAKQGKVPPGHARQMLRDGRLPPDLAYRYLPAELEGRLSRLSDGYVRIIVGSDVGILHTRTRLVADVIHDIAIDE